MESTERVQGRGEEGMRIVTTLGTWTHISTLPTLPTYPASRTAADRTRSSILLGLCHYSRCMSPVSHWTSRRAGMVSSALGVVEREGRDIDMSSDPGHGASQVFALSW